MLTGPRQAGKTTLLRYVEPNRRFVTLDDLENRTLASENPTLFLERYPPPVLIDEFQYAPQLLPYLKIAVDAKRTRMIESAGDYWLTGSQNFTMMEGVQESLAGRVVILKLMGLDLAEILRDETALNRPPFFERPRVNFETDRGVEELFSMILQGDKPELWKQGPNFGNTADYYISYIQTCLERDVRSQLG
ncbi:MAG: AAA family ATPase, partial [Deltaproteobacteria bacterium]|nr:AAA family ATPase [Deltaproteobacteria bacterium]